MKNIIPLFIVIILFATFGCEDSSTDVNIDPQLKGMEPIGVDTTSVVIPNDAGGISIKIYNNTEDTLAWGDRLNITSDDELIFFNLTDEIILPGAFSEAGIMIDRDTLNPGSHFSNVNVNFDNEIIHTIEVETVVGSIDAAPIGVYDNFIRIHNASSIRVKLLNNSDYTWSCSAGDPVYIETTEDWMGTIYVTFNLIEPGQDGGFTMMIDDFNFPEGIYEGQIFLKFFDEVVQTINVELTIGY